jgi:hypothetical protein
MKFDEIKSLHSPIINWNEEKSVCIGRDEIESIKRKKCRLLPMMRKNSSDSKIMDNSFNTFLFIRGLSCPRSVHTPFTQNCLKLTIPGFPYNLFPISCGTLAF